MPVDYSFCITCFNELQTILIHTIREGQSKAHFRYIYSNSTFIISQFFVQLHFEQCYQSTIFDDLAKMIAQKTLNKDFLSLIEMLKTTVRCTLSLVKKNERQKPDFFFQVNT